MRVLSWVQSKIKGKKEKRATASQNFSAPEIDLKEPVEEWPQGLLTIGTFGNHDSKKQSPQCKNSRTIIPLQTIPELTEDEIEKLERELDNLLFREPVARQGHSENCRKTDDLKLRAKSISRKAKNVLMESLRSSKSRQPILLLLRKMFSRRSFAPAPSLRDPILEFQTEKLLRTLVSAKVYPQSSAQATMKFLEKRAVLGNKAAEKMITSEKEEREEETQDSCRWVNTDSEYIVLEI